MSHNHVRQECTHGFLYGQCRCPIVGKTVKIVSCDEVHEPFRLNVSQSEGLFAIDGLTRADITHIMESLEYYIEDCSSSQEKVPKEILESIRAGMKLIK